MIAITGVPAMVPNVTVNNNAINGNNVTLTLSWGKPFNNHLILNTTVYPTYLSTTAWAY